MNGLLLGQGRQTVSTMTDEAFKMRRWSLNTRIETRVSSLFTNYLLFTSGLMDPMGRCWLAASYSHPWTFAPWIVKLGDLIFCHFILGHNKQILRLNSLGNTLRFCCCHECFMNAPSSWKIFRIFLRSACFPLGWKDSSDSRPKLSCKSAPLQHKRSLLNATRILLFHPFQIHPRTHNQVNCDGDEAHKHHRLGGERELLYEIKYKSQVDNVLWQFNIFCALARSLTLVMRQMTSHSSRDNSPTAPDYDMYENVAK